ncbi:ctd nuclear envelope phosphatase 1 [Anaeramoeba flamelloides]|uniref:Ctd nuclear envelope phosphatase 1 n=1 Tax=Anaeramoeba flamelloides TaxID=1746091 RepID=A0ABQ8Y743_9EUKA|nr:ctd nuclear envelope phosphatase 1 [Anaeramoeba flamelloides]
MKTCTHPIFETYQNVSSQDSSYLEKFFNPLLLSEIFGEKLKQKESKQTKTIYHPKLSETKKIILCLDLDETLISSAFQKPEDYDFSCDFEDATNRKHVVYIKKRPMLDSFLQIVSKLFEVVIFTASLQEYADPILNKLDPKNQFFSLRLYRDSCSLYCGSYVKDLRLLTKNMDSILIVDDLPCSFLFQPENALKIPAFHYFKNEKGVFKFDDCLESVLSILKKVSHTRDVIKILQQSPEILAF